MPWLWTPPDVTPHLRGRRIFMRAPQADDYRAWYVLRRRSQDFLRPFEPRWTEADLGRRLYMTRLRRSRQEAGLGTDYTFFIFAGRDDQGDLLGGLTISNIRRRAAQFANVGYWMGEGFAGQGYMSEAVAAILPFAFDTLGLHRLHAAFMPHNAASRRVLEKNGFAEEGFAPGYLQIDGHWADHVLFGLTRERYEAARIRNGR